MVLPSGLRHDEASCSRMRDPGRVRRIRRGRGGALDVSVQVLSGRVASRQVGSFLRMRLCPGPRRRIRGGGVAEGGARGVYDPGRVGARIGSLLELGVERDLSVNVRVALA